MRKIILYIAKSLDGYIADEEGGVNWLCGQDENNNDMSSYSEFIKTVDTVILGYNTYHQIVTELSPNEWAYSGMKSYVITHRKEKSTDEIEFTDKPIENIISQLKAQPGKNVWICGGASIVNQLVSLNLIDRYHITIIPTILGAGIRLFGESSNQIKLKQIKTQSYNGITDLVYERR